MSVYPYILLQFELKLLKLSEVGTMPTYFVKMKYFPYLQSLFSST